MVINKKLLHFNEYLNFNSKKLSANSDNTQYTLGISDLIYNGEDLDIKYQSIVFIKDTKLIWTHGLLYNSLNIDLSDYLTEELIRALIPTKLGELINDVGYITEANIDEAIYLEIYNQIINTADLENYYTTDEVDLLIENITIDSDNIDLSDYYTKDEVKELIEGIPGSDSDLTGYVKHEVFDPFKTDTETSISTLLTDKQNLLVSGVNIKTINNESLLGEGNITINGGSGGVEIIRTNDVTEPTDSNVYSAKRTDKDFTNRAKNETVDGAWSFNNNIIFDKAILSKEYGISNILGYGWFLGYNHFDDDGKGTNSHLEVDTLKVRKKATFDTLEIKHVAHVGGEIIISPAGATIESVEKTASGNFKCYIKTTDSEGNIVENQFAENDLVMCKTFNVVDVDENGIATANNTYYWRKCIGVGESYIILSDSDKDAKSDEPKEGNVIVTVGNSNKENSDRQNAIVLSSYSSTAPSIVLYKGINTFELTEEKAPVIISPEKNKFTGDVFISNMDLFNQTFVEILENLISLQVLGVSYEEILGSNAVIESEKSADGKSITFTLDPKIYKIWSKGDAIANILRFGLEVVDKKEEITTTIKVEQIEPSDKKYFEDIEINPEEIDLKLSKTSTLLENPSAESFKIKVSNDEGYLPWTLEVRSSFIKELKSRTGIDIENGQIILLADNTRIDTSDGKTLAEFTEDSIKLNTYLGVSSPVNGREAVKKISEDGSIIYLDGEVVGSWEKDDTILVELKLAEMPENNLISLEWVDIEGVFDDSKPIDIKLKNLFTDTLKYSCLQSVRGLKDPQLKVNYGKVESATIRRTMKYDLKRTGIDIESGTITLNADTTLIKDGDDNLSLAQFTKNNINFSVYDSIHEDLYGENVVASIGNVEGRKSIALNYDKIKDWEEGDLLNIYLSYNNFEISDKDLKIFSNDELDKLFGDITISGNLLDKVVSKTLPLSRVPKEGDGIILMGEYLPDEILVRSVLKQDLRRTGIDITNGLIVLQADETRINTSNGDTLALFTDARISLGLEDVNDSLGKLDQTLIEIQNGLITLDSDKTLVIDTEYGYPVTLAEFTRDQINLNVYEPYGDIFGEDAVVNYIKPEGTRVGVTLNSDITKNWEANDIISIKLKYNEFTAEGRKDVSISDSTGKFTPFTIPQKEIYSETIRTFTITSIPNIITINSENLPDEVLIRRVFPDGLKRTGIDIENGQITLDAETTVIKDGGEDLTLAKFTQNQIELNTYNNENYYTYGKNTVLEIDNTGMYSTITLDPSIIIEEGWAKGDVIDIVIETNLGITYDIDVSSYGLVQFDNTTITGIPYNAKTANKQVILVKNYVENPDKVPTISFDFAKSNDIVAAKVRRATLESRLNKTGINIADGVIVLDADGTYINDGNTTLATFTQDQIDLAVLGEVTDLYYEDDAVYSFLIFNGSVCDVNFKTEVANLWKYGDVIYFTIEFEEKITDTLLLTPTGPFKVQNLNIVLPSDSVAIIDNHKIGTYLTFTGNPDFSEVSGDYFRGLIISFSNENTVFKTIEARREILTSEFKKTSIDILNGEITLDADKTTIKDTDLTLALFTKDLASISVYESIKETLGDNAISGVVSSTSNQIIYNIDNEITTKWTNSPDLKLIIKFTQSAKDLINSLTINSTSNAFDGIKLNNEDINKSIFRDVLWKGNPGQASLLLLLAKFKSGSTSSALPVLIETVELRQTIKSGLKRTGIDIESGLITLDADKTLIKSSNLTLAEFTDDKISFKVGDYGINAVEDITFNQSSLSYVISLNTTDTQNWVAGDNIIVKLTFTKLPATSVTLIWKNIGPALSNKVVTINNLNSTIEFTCNNIIPGLLGQALVVSGGLVSEAVIYRKLNDAIKYTGIDLESGQITLNSDRTVIKSGDKRIALFSTDENGNAFIRTELIDAEKISADKLETKGTINENNKKTDYINISNNSMIVFGDNGDAKTIIHSGPLASEINNSWAGSQYTLLDITLSTQSNIVALASPISTTFETNYSYLEDLEVTITRIKKEGSTASTSNASIMFTPYLYTTYGDTINRLYPFSAYEISQGEILQVGGYNGSIKFSGRTSLLAGVTYHPMLLIEKTVPDDFEYNISISGDSYLVIKGISAVTEIASDGYNFNFSKDSYQNANQSGFITAYRDYGLKIDETGIWITKNAGDSPPKWYNLFERLGIN